MTDFYGYPRSSSSSSAPSSSSPYAVMLGGVSENEVQHKLHLEEHILYMQARSRLSSLLSPCEELLNSIPGLSVQSSCFYGDGTASGHDKAAILFWIDVADVRALNNFMWMGCRRFIRISKGDWRVTVNDGDPNKYSDKLQIVLETRATDLSAAEVMIQLMRLESGLKRYIDSQQPTLFSSATLSQPEEESASKAGSSGFESQE